MSLSKYRKTIAAIIVGLIGWATVVVNSPSTKITSSEWIMLAVALATALGVYITPNEQ